MEHELAAALVEMTHWQARILLTAHGAKQVPEPLRLPRPGRDDPKAAEPVSPGRLFAALKAGDLDLVKGGDADGEG